MATIMPISTNTTIATCIQIQVGDIERLPAAGYEPDVRLSASPRVATQSQRTTCGRMRASLRVGFLADDVAHLAMEGSPRRPSARDRGGRLRSEERRVGKECGCRVGRDQ